MFQVRIVKPRSCINLENDSTYNIPTNKYKRDYEYMKQFTTEPTLLNLAWNLDSADFPGHNFMTNVGFPPYLLIYYYYFK